MKELLERKGMLDEKLRAALRGVESDERRNEIKSMRLLINVGWVFPFNRIT